MNTLDRILLLRADEQVSDRRALLKRQGKRRGPMRGICPLCDEPLGGKIATVKHKTTELRVHARCVPEPEMPETMDKEEQSDAADLDA